MLFAGGEVADVGDDGVEERLGALVAVAAQGVDQAGFAEFVMVFVEGFGDAVGVEGEDVAWVDSALADFAVPLFENAEDSGSGVEAIDRIVAAVNECGWMAATDVAEAAGGDVEFGEEESGERTIGRVLAEELVDCLENALRLVEANGALASKIGLQAGHQQGGGDAFAGNITDDQAEAVGAELEKIVVITSDGSRWIAVTGIVEDLNRRMVLREKAALDFTGDFEFLRVAPFQFELFSASAALGF